MSDVLVRARGVSRHFSSGPERLEVLDDVSLAVAPGELALLVGPSGSGKTTLLSILAGLLAPDAGTVELAGERIDDKNERARARVRRASVGFVFQSFELFEPLSALDNVAEVLALRGGSIHAARATATKLLEEVGLGKRLRHKPAALSAGQRQRVAIARAFATEPRVLFADEPTASLDGTSAKEVMRLLRERVSGDRCALIVTHDLRLSEYADRVLALTDGRLEEVAA